LLPGGASLFTGSRDSLIKRWGAAGGAPDGVAPGFECQASLEGHCGWVTALAHMGAAPHGLLISASYDTTIKLWDPSSQARRDRSWAGQGMQGM